MSYRVAMVGACPYPVPQGSQVLLRETTLALSRAGHKVHLVVYGYGIGDDNTGLPIHRGYAPHRARKTDAGPSWAKPALDLALTKTLRRVIREHHIEVVHAHNYEGLLVALAARKRPIIYHAHNALSDELPHYYRGAAWAQRVGSRLDRHLPRRADHVIAPHQQLADYLATCGCLRERITVVPPCIGDWPFKDTQTTDSPPPVLYTGNLDAYQNLDFLHEVMKVVRAAQPQARLVIATARRKTFKGAEIVPTPDFDSLRRVLATDCVFVCPRVAWSGYPIKLLNAMAAAKPIVACASSAYPLADNETGLIVPDNDPKAFALAVLELMSAPALRRRLGENARQVFIHRHNPTDIAAKITDIYSRVILDRAM